MPGLTVREVMSTEVITVSATSSIGAAVDRVLRCGHTHLVVVDDAEVLLDIVSAHVLTTALMAHLVERHQRLSEILAEPASVGPSTELADAAALMLDLGVDALGVVDGSGTLVGLLTWLDIGRAAVGTA